MVLLLMRWIERIPEPVLAAIVIHAVSKSWRLTVFKPYLQWKRDRTLAVSAILAVLAFGILDGLLAAIAISLILLLRQFAMPRLSVLGRFEGGHDFVGIALHPQATEVAGADPASGGAAVLRQRRRDLRGRAPARAGTQRPAP